MSSLVIKLILDESFLSILIDLLNTAFREYTILPEDPVKEDGM